MAISPKDRLDNVLLQISGKPGYGLSPGLGKVVIQTPRGTIRPVKRRESWTATDCQRLLDRLANMGVQEAGTPKSSSANGHRALAKVSFTEPDKVAAPKAAHKFPVYPLEDGALFVTPEIAKELLSRPFVAVTSDGRSLRQRAKSLRNLRDLKESLREKNFYLTHQGLAIGINGSLYDGRHRCEAILETGIAAWLRVTYNVHPDAVPKMDSGKKRRAGGNLSMEGYDNALFLGASARTLHCLLELLTAEELNKETKDPDGQILVRPWTKWYVDAQDMSDQRVIEAVHKNPDLPWSVDVVADFTQRKPVMNPGSMAVFRCIVLRENPQVPLDEEPDPDDLLAQSLDIFLQAIASGIGITSEEHVAAKLGQWRDTNEARYRHIKYGRELYLALLLKLWRYHSRGEEHKVSRVHVPGDYFPKAYRPTEAELKRLIKRYPPPQSKD